MSCCIKINLRYINKELPEWVKDATGNVFFDLETDLNYLKTRNLQTLTDFNTIGGEGVLGFSLPKTDKNFAILNSYGNPQDLYFDHNKIIPVTIQEGSTISEFDHIRILQVNAKGYEIEVFNGSDFWKSALENYLICDYKFEPFILSQSNLSLNWVQALGSVLYRFPLVDYGNWSGVPAVYDNDGNLISSGEAGIGDFRPWIHVWEFIKGVFCDIGWEIKSPILDTDWGQRLIFYALGDLNSNLEKYKFKAVVEEKYWGNAIYSLNNPIGYQFDTVEIKAYDDYNEGYDYGETSLNEGFYRKNPAAVVPNMNFYTEGLSGKFRFNFRIIVDTTVHRTDRLLQFKIGVYDTVSPLSGTVNGKIIRVGEGSSGKIETIEDSIEIDINPLYNYNFLLDTEIVSPFYIGEIIYFSLSPLGLFEILPGSAVWVEPIEVTFKEGSLIVPQTLLNCEYKFLDFFNGILHLIGKGMIDTNYPAKTVTLYHPDKTTLWDSSIPEPYFLNEEKTKNLSDFLICKEDISKLKTGIDNRFYELGYINSSDEYINEQGYTGEIQPYRKVIDFGEDKGYKNEITKDLNPFFEPTLIRQLDNMVVPANFEQPFVPVCWDNTNNEISTDIKPRLLIWAGFELQAVSVYFGGTPEYSRWTFDGITYSSVPYAYANGNLPLSPFLEISNYNVIYGDFTGDLYEIFWRVKIAELQYSFTIELKGVIISEFFKNSFFRYVRNVDYESKKYLAKLLSVEDYNPCKDTPVKFILQPTILKEELICAEEIVGVIEECENSPEILIEFDPLRDCIQIYRSGTINSPIATDILYYRYQGDTSWTTMPATNKLCGCDIYWDIAGNIVVIDRDDIGPNYAEIQFRTTQMCNSPNLLVDTLTINYPGANPPRPPDVYNNIEVFLTIKTTTEIYFDGCQYYAVGEENTPGGVIRWTALMEWLPCQPGLPFNIGDVLVTLNPYGEDTEPIYRPIEFRRLVTYSDGCPPSDIIVTYTATP